jgi:hypothetical protein
MERWADLCTNIHCLPGVQKIKVDHSKVLTHNKDLELNYKYKFLSTVFQIGFFFYFVIPYKLMYYIFFEKQKNTQTYIF